ncbi:MAG: hypothetical protein LBT59_30790 [Clostridiales bacterium]|jgi:hypothetical protein|nr:hypothetical protein [Clostridiales bacterium]
MEEGKEHFISKEPEKIFQIGNDINDMKNSYLIEDFLEVVKYELKIPNYHVRRKWTIDQKSDYVEQLILKGSFEPIVFYEKEYRAYEVIDGVERIKALVGFYTNKFAISKTKISDDLIGVKFHDLPWNLKRIFINNRIMAYIIEYKMSREQKIDLMNRLNADFD